MPAEGRERRDEPEDEFDRIVAGLDLTLPEGFGVDTEPEERPADADDLQPERDVFQPRISDPVGPQESDEPEEAERFEPPELGPMPPLDPASKIAWIALLASPVVLVVATVIGWVMPRLLSGALVITFIGSIVFLIAKRGNDNRGDDPDHGAVI